MPGCLCCALLSRVGHFVTPWTRARQAPLFMEFPRREHQNGFHCLLQSIFPIEPVSPVFPGIEPMSPALAGRFFTTEPSLKPTRVTLYFPSLRPESVISLNSSGSFLWEMVIWKQNRSAVCACCYSDINASAPFQWQRQKLYWKKKVSTLHWYFHHKFNCMNFIF